MNPNLEGVPFKPFHRKTPASETSDSEITLSLRRENKLPEVAGETVGVERTAGASVEKIKSVTLNPEQLELIYYGIFDRAGRNHQSIASVLAFESKQNNTEHVSDYRWARYFYDTIKMYAALYDSFEMKYKFAANILNTIEAGLNLTPDAPPIDGAALVAAIKKSVHNYDALIQRLAKP